MESDPPARAAGDALPVERSAELLLLGVVFVLAICGLVYELAAGTVSSYLLGDSVTQFSLVIGLYLTAMGAGSFFSKYLRGNLLSALAWIELSVGIVGGFLGLIAMATYSYTAAYRPVMVAVIALIGVLVGLEIPLLVRIFRGFNTLRVTLSHVLCADYLGALAASLAFPFLLLPHLTLVRACFAMGILNVLVAGLLVWRFRRHLGRHFRALAAAGILGLAALSAGAVFSTRMVRFLENRLYRDEIVYTEETTYQRMVITRWRDDIRLYLDGHLQFSSVDEYRYHEALVHPAMASAERRAAVLILGGGDGCAAREALKYPDVVRVDLVDIDPAVTDLFSKQPMLLAINGRALLDPTVRVHNRDALNYLRETARRYDVILIDLPDPSTANLGKLYSQSFYRLVGRRLAAGGAVAVQATSPFRSREAFWCIAATLEKGIGEAGAARPLRVHPYHTHVPTFGQWGFMLACTRADPGKSIAITVETRYLTDDILPGLFRFPADMDRVETPVSRLNDPVVCSLYRRGYHKYLD